MKRLGIIFSILAILGLLVAFVPGCETSSPGSYVPALSSGNAGNITFANGGVIASGATNGDVLTIKANDTTAITLTTGATDTVAGTFTSLIAPTGRTATVTVAASNATATEIDQADYKCGANNAEVQILAAMNALPAAGGIVSMSTGTFNIGAQLSIPKNGITWEGCGYSTTVTVNGAVSQPIKVAARYNCTFRNIRFLGGSETDYLVMITRSSGVFSPNFLMDRCWIESALHVALMLYGANASGGPVGPCTIQNTVIAIPAEECIRSDYGTGNVIIDKCILTGGTYGVRTQNVNAQSDRISVTNCQISGQSVGGINLATPYSIVTNNSVREAANMISTITVGANSVYYANDTVITSNYCEGGDSIFVNARHVNVTGNSHYNSVNHGIEIYCTASADSVSMICNNMIDSPVNDGIRVTIDGTALYSKNVLVSGNFVDGAMNGIVSYGWTDIISNRFQNTEQASIKLTSVTPGSNTAPYIQCKDNTIMNGSQTGANPSISMNCVTYSTITNNTILQISGGFTPNYGIYEFGASSIGNVIKDNKLVGVYTTPISFVNATVSGNDGYIAPGEIRTVSGSLVKTGSTLTNGTGTFTGSVITLKPGANTVTCTVAGTATIVLPVGSTGKAETDSMTVTASPKALVAGSNSIETTGTVGTITVTIYSWTFAVQNPEARACFIDSITVDETAAGGTATSVCAVGIADNATGTNLGTEFFTAIPMNAELVYSSTYATDTGTQVKPVIWQNNAFGVMSWVVGRITTQSANNLVAKYYITYRGR